MDNKPTYPNYQKGSTVYQVHDKTKLGVVISPVDGTGKKRKVLHGVFNRLYKEVK